MVGGSLEGNWSRIGGAGRFVPSYVDFSFFIHIRFFAPKYGKHEFCDQGRVFLVTSNFFFSSK